VSVTVPTTVDFADYAETVALGGTIFRLRFTWNSRDASWYVSILGAGGGDLVLGIRVRTEWPINRQYVGADLPAGLLIPLDLEGDKREPGRDDLRDEKIPIAFLPTSEIAAAVAAG